MILSEKDKFGRLYDIQAVLKCSDINLNEEIIKLYPKSERITDRPFETVDGIQIKKGTHITFEELLSFWDAKTDDELVKATAKTYFYMENQKEIARLPMFKFLRMMEYGKDVAVYAAEQFATIKRTHTPEEIAAGIQDIKSDHFSIIDGFCLRNGIVDREIGYETPWMIIFRCFEEDFKRDTFARRYSEVIERKTKKK